VALPCLQLTPVAKLEPVELGGVTIQNVSLHNAGHLRDMQLARGDIVSVERAGDVIPQVCKPLQYVLGSSMQNTVGILGY